MSGYKGRSVLILGLGISGRAAADFLLKRGAHVTGVDGKWRALQHEKEIEQLQEKGLFLCSEQEVELLSFTLVVVSPGIPPSHPLYRSAKEKGLEIIGEAELAFRDLKGPCLAVTGSNGKTTTVLMTEHILNCSGVPAKALGNVGVPLSSAVDQLAGEVTIAELSSWQLETLKSPVIDAGVILNITPNHLDRHGTMESYALAKLKMIRCLKTGCPLYMGTRSSQEFAHLMASFRPITFGYERGSILRCDREYVRFQEKVRFRVPSNYRGKVSHDMENLMASYALCQILGVTEKQFLNAFETFQKPSHRIEFVRRVRGVAYYDDSKGSNVEAVIKAVASLEGPIFLIAGGVHKGASYTAWIQAFVGKVRCLCAIGQAAPLIKEQIGESIPVEIFSTLQETINFVDRNSSAGDNVLLSPGCASFDMFRDYIHRGEEFQRLVFKLEE
jgi:UDP-N-acetylmuramoylalanine--D-glutamate ligase